MQQGVAALSKTVPLCLPKLPKAQQILPYLERIDANRWYSNYGPLTRVFLARIAQLFHISVQEVICAANGTLLLELCLKAMNIAEGSLCIIPSWTFIATPLAVVSANLKPLFVDVDLITQSFDPEKLLADLPELQKMGPVGAVIVVAPFGMPVDVLAWDSFTEKTGIPVIIDAAAGFDSVLTMPQMPISSTPIMISLHATKVLGIGEGGILMSTNQALIDKIESLTQFGFPKGIRNAQSNGTNAKISEYGAAVALAALDHWPATRTAWQEIGNHYLQLFSVAKIKHLMSVNWVTSTCNVFIPMQANSLVQKLNRLGIQARKWWGEGCHHQTAFQHALATDLSNTEVLRQSVFGLPFYIGLECEEIEAIVHYLTQG